MTSMISQIKRMISLGAIRTILTSPRLWILLPSYIRDLLVYRTAESANKRKLRIYPCLTDKKQEQLVGFYFYQDSWAARQVFREKPEWMVDIGSTRLLAGILSQFIRLVSVDIRPIAAHLENFEPRRGSILNLPFDDNQVPCLTTMCVLEHIGLGRYGDPLDPYGTYKAVKEIQRVIRPGGIVVFSLPVGESLLEFNAHRRFTIQESLQFFAGWQLIDGTILDPEPKTLDEKSINGSDSVICLCLRKPENA